MEGEEYVRPGGISQAAAEQKAKQFVAKHGPKLDTINAEGLTNQLAVALILGQNAADPTDLVLARIKTGNKIYTLKPGGYQSFDPYFKDMVQRIGVADWNELDRMNAELDVLLGK